MTKLRPVRREILVEGGPAAAFAVFTERIGSWWPVGEFSVYGPASTVAFEDDCIVERSPEGATSVWGTVTEWSPGRRVSFTWHPGKEADRASVVSITFHERGERTLVVLEHSGWEIFADPEAARDEYGRGWPVVLARFADCAALSAPSSWVALMHAPGPTAPSEGSVFQDPRFPQHLAFLDRMEKAGYLVAAGPLADAAGSGMTVLRLPGAHRYEDAVRLATQGDNAVVSGLLQVDVRPWEVMLQAVIRPRAD